MAIRWDRGARILWLSRRRPCLFVRNPGLVVWRSLPRCLFARVWRPSVLRRGRISPRHAWRTIFGRVHGVCPSWVAARHGPLSPVALAELHLPLPLEPLSLEPVPLELFPLELFPLEFVPLEFFPLELLSLGHEPLVFILEHDGPLRVVFAAWRRLFTSRRIHVGVRGPSHVHRPGGRGVRFGLTVRPRRRNGPARAPLKFSWVLHRTHRRRRWPEGLRRAVPLHFWRQMHAMRRASIIPCISCVVHSLVLFWSMRPAVSIIGGAWAHPRRSMRARRIGGRRDTSRGRGGRKGGRRGLPRLGGTAQHRRYRHGASTARRSSYRVEGRQLAAAGKSCGRADRDGRRPRRGQAIGSAATHLHTRA